MLLITERRQIGVLFGHSVYAVSKSEIVALQNTTVQCNIANSRDENRFSEISCAIFFVFSFLKITILLCYLEKESTVVQTFHPFHV